MDSDGFRKWVTLMGRSSGAVRWIPEVWPLVRVLDQMDSGNGSLLRGEDQGQFPLDQMDSGNGSLLRGEDQGRNATGAPRERRGFPRHLPGPPLWDSNQGLF